jgi:hypothetical protein
VDEPAGTRKAFAGEGMKRDVTVGLSDLKAFVKAAFEKDVRKQAEVMVLTAPGMSDAESAFEFDRLVSTAEPEARKRIEKRYRRLLEAVESGVDVGPALAAFLHRGR